MQNQLLSVQEQSNTIPTILSGFPHFITIQNIGKKQIKIPCANKLLAEKLSARYQLKQTANATATA